MSRLGKLHGHVSIDGGSQKPHYGPDDAVTGQVILSYEPHTNMLMRKTDTADLFGPLQIKLTVHGKVNVGIRHERELSTHREVELFKQELIVHEGSFKAQAGNTYSFPWIFSFPEDARSISSRVWIPTPTASLPPTFGMHFHASPDLVGVRVGYSVQLAVSVNGINVKISVPREDRWPAIKYDLPRPPRISTSTFTDRVMMSGDQLLTSERLNGLSEITTTSNDLPQLFMDMICSDHRQIYPGQLLSYRIKICRNERLSTMNFLPKATLKLLRVELVSTTSVNASERILGSSVCVDNRTLQKFDSSRSLPAKFSEANDNAVDVVLDYVSDIPTSFSHREASRSYKLRVEVQLSVANKLVRVNRDCPVTVVPPPANEGDMTAMPPDSLAQSLPEPQDDLPPPTYEEVTAGSSRGSQGHENTSRKDQAAPPYKTISGD